MADAGGIRKGTELAGKVALVTGGARNIGRAISRALAAGGASVMVNVHTSIDAAKETVGMIEAAGGKAAYHVADITDEESVRKLVDETICRFGRL
ncbi:MAG TPA: SDR family NAD(P)-dependent oxidoreductase, partial [Burkholderiales bacterium]|nr:SDR family NAD(P)-dependent oxidoreductase [Burkholderiales bacterium]